MIDDNTSYVWKMDSVECTCALKISMMVACQCVEEPLRRPPEFQIGMESMTFIPHSTQDLYTYIQRIG